MHILEKIQLAEAEYKKVAAEYSRYITDKSIPLWDRWETYMNAPDGMKYKKDYIVKFNHEILKQLYKGHSRYITINICAGIVDIVHNGIIYLDNLYVDGEFSDQDVMDAMEELLECNISTFINDW